MLRIFVFKLVTAVILYGSSIFEAHAANILYTEIEKLSAKHWQVSYQSQTPIKAIMFANSPDDSRIARWQPLSDAFKISYINGREIVARKDATTFTSVTFKLTPTYIHLPKNYAPFSPFSNNAMLLHSGRFFACPNICSGNENLWAMAVKAPAEDNIFVDGISYKIKTSWWDKNDGQKLYIGQQLSHDNGSYIGIVDPELSSEIAKQMELMLPKMMSILEESYGVLPKKPMLFASYSETNDGRFGHQGGTLPNQVFMHWYGHNVYKEQDAAATLWFFAHEAAHMYQHMSGSAVDPVDNWMHEGHAEMMAKKIMLSLSPQYEGFVRAKVSEAKSHCLASVNQSTLVEQVALGNYRALYQCGFYIFNTIENGDARINTTETLWLDYMKEITGNKKVSSDSLLSLAELSYGLSKENNNKFRNLIGNE